MKLGINNIMKIAHADIELDGITVIAGENNTGKSTIGKTLWAVTESLYNFEEFVQNAKEKNIREQLELLSNKLDLLCKELSGAKRKKTGKIDRLRDRYTDIILKESEDGTLKKLVEEYRTEFVELYSLVLTSDIVKNTEEWIIDTFNQIRNIVDMDENLVGCNKVTPIFSNVFSERMIKAGSEEAVVTFYDEKGKCNEMHFQRIGREKCVSVKRSFFVGNRAYFIGGSDILDNFERLSPIFENTQRKLFLKQFLAPAGTPIFPSWDMGRNDKYIDSDTDDMDLFFEKIDLTKVMSKIAEIMNGQFVTENKRMRFKESETGAMIPISNMSEGLKSVALLERIISYNFLTKNTVLILDEPEINLHPEWQLTYAEILVMLQKELDLKVVLTTHSPYFLKAIEYFAEQYDRSSVCHYYYAANQNGSAEIRNVDDMTNIIFKKLALPLIRVTNMEE